MPSHIKLTDTIQDVITTLSKDNMGALSVMVSLVKTEPHRALMYLLDLDDMNMTGPAIWIGYNDYCGRDLEKFKKALIDRDPNMVRTIRDQGYPEVVERGNSR